MTDLTKLLRDADPLRDRPDERLSDGEVQVMRRAMLEAARESVAAGSLWRRPLAFAAIALVLVAVGGIAGDRARDWTDRSTAISETAWLTDETRGSSGDLGRRQVQFATPGGTRIIWILDPNLPLQESMP